jgi:ABC-type multidrug transport system fused ATPase/permease subunit
MKKEAINRSDQNHQILWFVRPYVAPLIMTLVCSVFTSALSLVDPIAIKILIDDVLLTGDTGFLAILVIGMVLLLIVRGAIRIITAYLMSYVGARIVYDIRRKLFTHILALDIHTLGLRKAGDIISRLTGDVDSLRSLLTQSAVSFFSNLTMLLLALTVLFILHKGMALMIIAVIPFFYISLYVTGKRVRREGRSFRVAIADLTSVVQEAISNIRQVKSFVMEWYETRKHAKKGKAMIRASIRYFVYSNVGMVVAGSVIALGPIAALFMGSRLVMRGELTLGGLMAFYAVLARMLAPVRGLADISIEYKGLTASMQRIAEYLEEKPRIISGSRRIPSFSNRTLIRFDDVSFCYDKEEQVLDHISFEIRRGQTVALVGASGEGKSTIIDLLYRFCDPQEGRILVGGVDLRDLDLKAWRRTLGVVSQNLTLFNASIKENIRYAKPDAGEQDIAAVARALGIDLFVNTFKDGYNTIVGERGIRLSAGQRQRVSIAGVFLRDPLLLVFDEATAFLDAQAENLLGNELMINSDKRAILIISHRLSTVELADTVLVLQNGRIVQSGSPRALKENTGVYRSLFGPPQHLTETGTTAADGKEYAAVPLVAERSERVKRE